jgi:RNA polymerase sigma factor for flagellar operon FliA
MIGEPEPVTTSSSGTVSLNSNYIEEEGMQMYEMMADDGDEPLQILEKNEMKERLVEMIKQLSDRDRMIITLYYYEELNYQEIAKVLNITVSRVSQLHSKIMKILKQKLSEKNG